MERNLKIEEEIKNDIDQLIKKIANAAWNEVDLEDLLYAAGIFPADARVRDEDESSPAGIADKVRNLSPKSRKSAERTLNNIVPYIERKQ